MVAEVNVLVAAEFEGGGAVGHDQASGCAGEGNKPARVLEAKTKGTGPHVLLIAEQVAKEIMFGRMWNFPRWLIRGAEAALTREGCFAEEASK